MKSLVVVLIVSLAYCARMIAEEIPASALPPQKIIPGQIIFPVEQMERPWGELISLNLADRTGKFRRESNGEIVEFSVMPYAELVRYVSLGDLQDFRVGERAVFRIHENEPGRKLWLTCIQDELNVMSVHEEYLVVGKIDSDGKRLLCKQEKLDQSYVREEGIIVQANRETRYWKLGKPAKFSDIKIGQTLRTKTHGVRKGKVLVAREIFLDDQSLLKLQLEQEEKHVARMLKDGAPGYIDKVETEQITLTLFYEGEEQIKQLKPGSEVRISPAAIDRKATAEPITGSVTTLEMRGRSCRVVIAARASTTMFKPTSLARLWAGNERIVK